jgi:hypothetical protein
MIRSNSIPGKVYKFVHKRDEWILTNLTMRSFVHDRLLIEESGKITVKCSYGNGYAWDGCSPKFNFLQFTCGTPDGRLDYGTEKPMTYYASMFHDALYQFKLEGCISRKETDIIFKILLKKAGFIWRLKYFCAVRIFGGFYGNWNQKTSATGIAVYRCSWDHQPNDSV